VKRIYVAGPYTKGDVAVNVRTAVRAGIEIIKAGHAPFVPHLCHFMHYLEPHHYEIWMAQDFEWVRACHALLRLPGESSGADREVALAEALGIPVYRDMSELLAGVY
jgi:hypothetical protein